MSDAVLVAIVTGGLSLLGVVFSVIATIKKSNADLLAQLERQSEINDVRLEAKLKQHQAITETKIDELTREVREHNNFAHRVPVLEEKVLHIERTMGSHEQSTV